MSVKSDQCRYYGHDWSEWTLWQPIFHPMQPFAVSAADTLTPKLVTEKVRARQCRRCMITEQEDGTGKRVRYDNEGNPVGR